MLPQKRLAEFLGTPRYQKALGRVRKYRCPVDPEDLEGEFNLALILAAKKARLDIGDPVEFVVAKAMWHVRQVVRTACNHEILEECLVCHKVRPYRSGHCKGCGARNFALHSRAVHLEMGETGEAYVPSSRAVCETFGAGSAGRPLVAVEDVI